MHGFEAEPCDAQSHHPHQEGHLFFPHQDSWGDRGSRRWQSWHHCGPDAALCRPPGTAQGCHPPTSAPEPIHCPRWSLLHDTSVFAQEEGNGGNRVTRVTNEKRIPSLQLRMRTSTFCQARKLSRSPGLSVLAQMSAFQLLHPRACAPHTAWQLPPSGLVVLGT
ncbi:unnamed protein product [Rangifer tarandus platyrhynchus]|uniref:Uncharacterized protein n=1 Tax=Rangifer tarandus platyrhynchus TaxID=3082113 RepID=A0AC59Z6S9_RANTA